MSKKESRARRKTRDNLYIKTWRNKPVSRGMERIAQMLDTFLEFGRIGLDVFFLPDEPLPPTEELAAMVECARRRYSVDSDRRVRSTLPEAQRIIESAEEYEGLINTYGGLAFWKDVFARYLREKPNQAQLLRDLGMRGTLGIETLDDIAAKHGYSERKSIYRVKADYIYYLANTIYVQGKVIIS